MSAEFNELKYGHGDVGLKVKVSSFVQGRAFFPSLYHRHVSLDITADADDFRSLAGKKLDLSKRDFMHTEPLDTFNERKRKFMAYNFIIKLTSPPSGTKEMKFTIDYLNESGVPLSVTTKPLTINP